MTRTQRVLLAAALVVIAVGLYAFVPDSGELDSPESQSARAEKELLEASAAQDQDGVVGLETTAPDPAKTDTLGAPPAPVDLDQADRARDLHGIVVRTDDTPVAGASLKAVYYPWRYGRLLTDNQHSTERLGPTTRSARDGTFSLRLRPGDHVHLRVAAEGLASTEMTMMQAGERIRVVLPEAVRLIVRVRTPTGAPADGLELRVFRGGRGTLWFERTGTTGADGSFTFADLPPAEWIFLDPRPVHAGWGSPSWIRLQLPASADLTHEFTLPPGRTLRGTVTDATTGKPISGARVGMNWTLTPETKTDAEGRYELHSWSGKGVSDIHVLATGYGREQVDVESKEELDFQLTSGFGVRGRVRDEQGRAISGAQVMAVGSERAAGGEKLSMDHAITDAEGAFLLRSLRREMPHVLTVIARGFAQGLGDLAPCTEQAELDLGDIVLKAPRTLVGTLGLTDGKPVARVQINLRIEEPGTSGYRRGRAWERRTDDLGRFRFEDLPPGDYTVSTRPNGGAGLSQKVQVLDRDEPTVVALVRQIVREVRIRVTDSEGKPVASAHLQARPESGQAAQAQTDTDGYATLQLPKEVATVRVVHFGDGKFVAPEPLTLTAEQTEGAFVLKPAATTTGTLLDPAGKPVPWATLEVEIEGGAKTRAWTDAEGKFSVTTSLKAVFSVVFRGMAGPSKRERYRMEQKPMKARREGLRAGSTDVVLQATALATDASIGVQVLDPEGNPVVGLSVMLPGSAQSRTDAQGRVRFENLVARRTTVRIYFQSTAERPWVLPPVPDCTPEGQEVLVRLRAGARIEGTLLTKDGDPSPGFVTVMRGKQFLSSARAGPNGHFVAVVDSATSGPFTLQSSVRTPDGKLSTAKLEDVQPGDTGVVLRYADPK